MRLLQSWLKSKNVQTFTGLKEFILLEEFKHFINVDMNPHLDEQEVTTLSKAVILADNFFINA